MARYIDADKLIAHLNDEIKGCNIPFGSRGGGKGIAYGTILGLKSAISFAQTLPTAEVAPKSEVAREIFEEIEKICTDFPLYGNQDTLILSERDFAELKKKYKEEEK